MRRIGELLLRGVYLWVETTGDSEAAEESLPEAATEVCAAGGGYLREGPDAFGRQDRPTALARRKSSTGVVQSRSRAEGIDTMG